ncbi:hypothetical protein HPDFL43_01555 [Hoeflea phototrophica DFL-43]|uniref:Uncharacterized protein n=1 Tax=Hoeflea phototrophica (strain DSM 17068 / NCIMB 14078 / DFL-43) TaxID=411684 RepID=A9CZT6_HOEPD|nr:hypothetical protein HPDFL43_01555 [Hoeflea phototrophica DFL-43]
MYFDYRVESDYNANTFNAFGHIHGKTFKCSTLVHGGVSEICKVLICSLLSVDLGRQNNLTRSLTGGQANQLSLIRASGSRLQSSK